MRPMQTITTALLLLATVAAVGCGEAFTIKDASAFEDAADLQIGQTYTAAQDLAIIKEHGNHQVSSYQLVPADHAGSTTQHEVIAQAPAGAQVTIESVRALHTAFGIRTHWKANVADVDGDEALVEVNIKLLKDTGQTLPLDVSNGRT